MSTTTDAPYASIHAALCHLAGACDGAQARDGAGFNKPDAFLGKRLAALDSLDDAEARQAWELLRTYTRQLAAAGIDYGMLPVPPALDHLTHRIGVLSDGSFIVVFPYDAQHDHGHTTRLPLGQAVRNLVGRSWNGQRKRWEVAATRENATALLEMGGEYDFHISASARARIDDLQHAPALQAPVPQAATRTLAYEAAVNAFVASFPYDAEVLAALKGSLAFCIWEGTRKVWRIPADKNTLASVQRFGQAHGFDLGGLDAYAQAEAQRLAQREAQRVATDQALQGRLARLDLDAPFADGSRLRPFQRQGVQRLLSAGRALLADQMGLGKTRQALTAAKAYAAEGCRILVVAPVSLKASWLREAAVVEVPIEVFSWAKVPTPLEQTPYVLIGDECHFAQNLTSQRTKQFLALAEHAQAVWCLTGTPIKNGRPANLYPLLKACRHPVADDKHAYERRYCAAKPTKWSRWDVTGASHLDELHGKIQDILILRTKAQVAKELPAKTRVLLEAALPPEALRLYRTTMAALSADYRQRKAAGQIQSGGEALVALTHARHAGELAKAHHAATLAADLVEEGDQVLVFAETRDALAQCQVLLAEAGITDVAVLTGETPQDQRQPLVDQFQAGQVRVFLATTKAGGVGLTLTGPPGVSVSPLLIGRPWTPGDAEQAEDRAHRIGQDQPVICHWLQLSQDVDRGVDAMIDDVLEQKYQRIQLVLQGRRASMQGIGSLADLAPDLADLLFAE